MEWPYEQLYEGDLICFEDGSQAINFSCCDCGLVHNIAVERKGHKVYVAFTRDQRRSGQRRRWNVYPFTRNEL